MPGIYKEATEKTKQNFIDAFWKLYAEKDIRKITVNEIAKEAGYNRNSFYRYFKDIYDVLEQEEERIAYEFAEYCDTNKTYDVITAVHSEILKKESDKIQILFQKDNETRFSVKLKEKCRPMWEKTFMLGEDEKLRDYVIEYKVAGSISVMVRYFKNNKNMPQNEIVDIMMDLTSTGKW